MTFQINIKSIFSASFHIVLISMLVIGCAKENNQNLIVEELHIDEALVPYFERFVAEGTIRGYEIDLAEKRIEGFLIDIEEDNVAGQCSYSSTSTRKVNIDSNYWENATDLEKEFVIFHELGHCYLDRSHLDEENNRYCTSIMHSGTTNCRFSYTENSRGQYLDELF